MMFAIMPDRWNRSRGGLAVALALALVASATAGCDNLGGEDRLALASATPELVDFGTVEVGADRTLTLEVVTASPDTVLALEPQLVVTGAPNQGAFALVGDGGAWPRELSQGERLVLEIRYAPALAGTFEAAVRIDFGPGEAYTVRGGGCSGDPEDSGLHYVPEPIEVPVRGVAITGGGPGALCDDIDGDFYQVIVDGCTPWSMPGNPDTFLVEPNWCDDDENRYPDAFDGCNGIDDDCDGETDEGYQDTPVTCGTGACERMGLRRCIDGRETDVCTPGDAAADDALCDGVDGDCDGETDEDFEGSPTTCGQGACEADGTTACVDGSVVDDCTPGTPAESDALCDGIDEDCDGETDEDVPGVGEACDGDDDDLCENGTLQCDSASGETVCEESVSFTEVCNGADDDCDGLADEDWVTLGLACDGDDEDLCENGLVMCTDDGSGVECRETVHASELCNAQDDDCDGETDEDFPEVGSECDGTPDCEVGTWGCTPEGGVACFCGCTDEICDGVDNDCDGGTDEDWPTVGDACDGDDDDLCENGTFVCNATADGVVCQGDVNIVEECNGVDDDCDGETDETWPELGTECDGTPDCDTGIWVCNADGTGVECQCNCSDEVCDGADNDCDGGIDEDWPTLGEACDGDDDDQCENGALVCNETGDGVVCEETITVEEQCSGADEDCDGETDEDWPELGDACDGDDDDQCENGTLVCNDTLDGTTCEESVNFVEECNGADDDCDGLTDEDWPDLGRECDEDPECNQESWRCAPDGAGLVCLCDCTGDEVCDGIDNDCDDAIDEDWPTLGDDCDGPDDDLCENGTIVCNAGGDGVVCEETLSFVERCNGADDDCDGDIDEDFPTLGDICDGADNDFCENGTLTCTDDGSGVECVNEPDVGIVVDLCDGEDNDCDGDIDEDHEVIATTCGDGECTADGTLECIDGATVDTCIPPANEPRDIPCNGIDDDCDGDIDEDLPIAGGVTGCAPDVPVVWTGDDVPAVSDECFGFTSVEEFDGQVRGEALTFDVGPGVRSQGGVLYTRTLPVEVRWEAEIQFDLGAPTDTVAAELEVLVNDYLGDDTRPGNALYLSNGSHGVWVNMTRRGVVLLTGDYDDARNWNGTVLATQDVLTQTELHTVRVVLKNDRDVRLVVDGEHSLTLADALVGAPTDDVARVRFGDWSEEAGAITGWDNLAIFTLPEVQLDVDLDDVTICDGDCDDTDPLVSPTLPESLCDGFDNDCREWTLPGGDPNDPTDPTDDGYEVMDSCDDLPPVLWNGETVPAGSGDCDDSDAATVTGGPGLTVIAGALQVNTTGNLTDEAHWTFDWTGPADDTTWLVARARVRVDDYTGPASSAGNALSLWNGMHALHLNITADGVALLGAGGTIIDEVQLETTDGFHDYWLVVEGDRNAYVLVDGARVTESIGGVPGGESTAALMGGFGDRAFDAGAIAAWDDFSLFAVTETGLLDLDGDGFRGCDDCNDNDPAIRPEQGDILDGVTDLNCDGGPPGQPPYCSDALCPGPLPPDLPPELDDGGCYRVFEYPDGWDGEGVTLDMGASLNSLGDIDGDGIADLGFNYGDDSYLVFGQREPFSLHAAPNDAGEGYDVRIGAADPDERVSQLGLNGVSGGDINGDGFSDVVLGAYFDQNPGVGRSGRVFVYFGRTRAQWSAFYSAPSTANIIIGRGASDSSTALSAAVINDLNGDGRAEIGVRAMQTNLADRFYVFFGQADWDETTSIELSNDDADLIYTDPFGGYSGLALGDAIRIAGIGDFDRDGFNDMALGTPTRAGQEGGAFIVFGGAGVGYWPAPGVETPLVDAGGLSPANVLRFAIDLPGFPADGAHISEGGDLNADGYADFVFTGRFHMYVIAGRDRADLPVLAPGEAYDPTVQGDFVFEDPDTTLPFDMAYAGDINGDGFDDLLVSTGQNAGPNGNLDNVSYLYYGRPVLEWDALSTVRGSYDVCFWHGPTGATARVGVGGDFNDDGLSDMLFSAPLRHEVRVLYGDWY